MLINNYLSKKFLINLIVVILTIATLTFLIDFIENLRRFASKETSLATILEISLFKQIPLLSEILPFTVFVASIIFFAKLSSNSEVTILNAAGLAKITIFKPIIILILIIAVLDVVMLSHVSSYSKKLYEVKTAEILGKKETSFTKKIWFRNQQKNNNYLLEASNLEIQKNAVNFAQSKIIFAGNHPELLFLQAESGKIIQDKIILTQVTLTDKNYASNVLNEYSLNSNITPQIITDKIDLLQKQSEQESFLNLLPIIFSQKNFAYNKTNELALFNYYLAKPIFYLFLLLVAAYLCNYPPRYKRKTIKIIIAIATGFMSYFLLNIAYSLVASAKLNLFIGIWLSHGLLFLLVLFLLIKKEFN